MPGTTTSNGTAASHVPAAEQVMMYGDLVEVTYDNFKVSDKPLQRLPDGADIPSGEEISGDLNLGQIILGSKFGQPRYWISAEQAKKHNRPAGLEVFLTGCNTGADKFVGVQDMFAYSGPLTFLLPKEQDLLPEDGKELPPAISSWIGYIAERKPQGADQAGELAIVFRGTQLKTEWLSDAWSGLFTAPYDYDASRPDMGKVHRGFYGMYTTRVQGTEDKSDETLKPPKEVIEQVLSKYKSQSPRPRITILGHSLGGALATVCGMHVIDFMGAGTDVNIMTFNSPKVGDTQFCHKLTELGVKMYRVVNNDDIVKELPPGKNEEVQKAMQALKSVFPKEFKDGLSHLFARGQGTDAIAAAAANVDSSTAAVIANAKAHPQPDAAARKIAPAGPEPTTHTPAQRKNMVAEILDFLGDRAGKGSEMDQLLDLLGTLATADQNGIWDNIHNDWVHCGTELRYYNKEFSPSGPVNWAQNPAEMVAGQKFWTWGDYHNLQALLFLAANRAGLYRDVSLMNKGGEFLKKDWAAALGITASWWDPECDQDPQHKVPNKGMQVRRVFACNRAPLTQPSADVKPAASKADARDLSEVHVDVHVGDQKSKLVMSHAV